jgi:hypothetical protein
MSGNRSDRGKIRAVGAQDSDIRQAYGSRILMSAAGPNADITFPRVVSENDLRVDISALLATRIMALQYEFARTAFSSLTMFIQERQAFAVGEAIARKNIRKKYYLETRG